MGAICLHQATGPDVIREHAQAADLPADEIIPITATDVARPDPEPADPGASEGTRTPTA